jgi:hypothetical protein
MSLNSGKPQAVNKVKNLLEDMLTRENNSTQEFAERIVDVLEVWLKEATIKYVNGLVAGSNPVTGTFNGKLE